jgi:PAS domain S-box-containing protein
MPDLARELQVPGARGIRILPVEDERIVARYLRLRLRKLGYEVTDVASSMQEAVQLAEMTTPDLVLMDIQLNGRPEGIDAAREIRARFDIPVIYLTAHSDSDTIEQAKLTEPCGYLLKPFEDRDLWVAIETAVHKHANDKRLRDSEDRLRLAQRAGHMGVFDWNLATNEILFTPELEEILGLPAGSFNGTCEAWVERIHSDDRPGITQTIKQWTESGSIERQWEHRIVRPDGEVRWMEARGRLYREVHGRAIRILGTELDITDRKRMEQALREKEQDLERSNADLQAYAHTVSHDLQEPLRTISCLVELLEQRCGPHLGGECRDYISSVVSGARRMSHMIGGLLEFSRAGHDTRSMSPVDCNAVLQEVLASLSAKIEQTKARISSGPLPTVQAWPGRLNQLLQNLIGNALKYSKGGIAPEISIAADLNLDCWHFTVKDNGIGFDMKDADQIFGVFKRLRESKSEGLGIGLSICKRIVERHGGRLWVESAPGEGAAFHFTVPARAGLAAHCTSSTN